SGGTRKASGGEMGRFGRGGSGGRGRSGGGGRRRSGGRGADRVHRGAGCRGRQEDRSDQGSPGAYRTWPQGSQGSRRRRAQDREGKREQGRGREDQGAARKG